MKRILLTILLLFITGCSKTPTPEVSVAPTSVPSVSPEITVSPEVSKDPSVSPEATATPSPKPTATPSVKPSAKPSAVPTVKPTVAPTPVPTPTPKPVLCAADGANPDLPCDVLVSNTEGADMIFEGDDENCTQCLAWGYSINPDDYPGLKSFFCSPLSRNDRSIWGSGGMLVY